MRRALAYLVAAGAACWADAASAQPAPYEPPLLTDLSSHLIAINSSFTGTDLLLFGSLDESGDVVVVVRGPTGPAVVRRKDRVFGIWANQASLEFGNVPGYYVVASNRPIYEIASPSLLARLQIGLDYLRFLPGRPIADEALFPFHSAIIRAKQRQGLYREEVGGVAFLGQKLFRTRIYFPATVPVGTYRAEVYLIRDDRVIAAQATPLFINKQAVEQAVFDYAHQQPLFYGLAAVLLAVAAGWIAAVVFNKP